MPFSSQHDGVQLRLRRYLAAQLIPLSILITVVVASSAPLAYSILGRRSLRVQATSTAEQIATIVREDAQERPGLWRYDTVKVLDHIRSYDVSPGIERIEIVDSQGALIDGHRGESKATGTVVWGTARLRLPSREDGVVWVAVSTAALRRDSVLLFLVFLVVGGALGAVMYRVPLLFVGRAERRISQLLERLHESQAALGAQAENLEDQVTQRSQELRRAYAELQKVSARAAALQEEERRAIARELHDSAGQSLTAIRLQLQLLSDRLVQEARPDLQTLSHRTMIMVDDCVEEIRRAVNRLGPAVLDDVGLRDAIFRVAEDLEEAAGIEVECVLDALEHLDASTETTCYRLVQEAMTNVARHAGASRLVIEIGRDPVRGGLAIRLEDDGVGIESAPRSGERRGLVGMSERVELLGGTLTIDRGVEGGTKIRVWLPEPMHKDEPAEDTGGST